MDDRTLAKLGLSRRTMLKSGVGAAAFTGMSKFGLRGSLAQDAEWPRFDGETVRVFTFAGNPFIEGPVKLHGPEFEALTGCKIEVITAPFADLYTKAQQVAQTGSGDFDVLLLSDTWVADFVALDYVVPMDDFIAADAADPNLAWDDVPDGLKRKDSWGGHIYTLIVDNDNHTMFTRKDILGDPTWQEKYKTDTGKELPLRPETFTEFTEVAQYFTGKDWDPSVAGGDKFGFISSETRGNQTFWYGYPWTAAYGVVPTDKAPAQGIYLWDPDMNPLVNKEGFVRGLTEFGNTIKTAMKPGGDAARVDVITEITSGRALMSIDWGDTGTSALKPESVVNGKLGFGMAPGVKEYFDWQTDTWVTMPEGEIHKVPTHAFNGWAYFITSQAKNPTAAWNWIKYHASPAISALDVASPDSGFQPWRTSHSTNTAPWEAAGWPAEDAQLYVQSILNVTNHPNAVFDPRVPSASAYQDTLELHMLRAVSGEVDAQTAMDDCAAEFNSITDDAGRDEQIAAYRAHLGMS